MRAYVARTAEIAVNTTTSGNQYQSTLARLPDGGYVIAWVDMSELNGDDDGRAIMAQRFDAKGRKVGDEIPVNSTTAGDQAEPTVTVLKSGDFVIAWTDGSAKVANGYEIRAQMFNKSGEPIRNEFQMNSTTPYIQSAATLTALKNGGFIAVWQSDERIRTGFEYGLHSQIYDAKGKKVGAEFRIDDASQKSNEQASVTTLSDGSVIVAWQAAAGIQARHVSATGKLLGAQFLVKDSGHDDGSNPDVTALSNGGFLVSWDSIEPRGISARLYNSKAEPVGPSFLVSDIYQNYSSPAAAELENGDIVIVYETSGGNVVAQLYDKAGAKLGSEMVLNKAAGSSGIADVIAMKGGGFTVTWTDVAGRDGSGAGVHALTIDADDTIHTLKGTSKGETLTAPSTAQWSLLGLDGDDTLKGGIYADTLDGGVGKDRMEGGTGADTYVIDNTGDVIVEKTGGGHDTVRSYLSTYTLPSFLEDLVLAGKGKVNGTGNDDANTITGTGDANTLDGGRGDDIVKGGDGADKLLGGTGDDLLDGGKGKDTLSGGAGHDTLLGGKDDDTLRGEADADRLDGGSGKDSMEGGAGDDVYVVDNTGDKVTEKSDQGTDRVESTITFTLGKYVENLTLLGSDAIAGAGNGDRNTLIGNKGANTLSGLGGDDVLTGGAGIDTLTGGSGKDRFTFDDGDSGNSSKTADQITDFAKGDRIDLSAIDAKAGGKDNAFTLIGTGAFQGHAGELRFVADSGKAGLMLMGDTNGDKTADFMIHVHGVTTLASGDLVL